MQNASEHKKMQEDSGSTDFHQHESGVRIRSPGIRSPDSRTLDVFLKLTGTFVSKDTSVIKFSCISFSRDMSQRVEKLSLAILKNLSKNSDLDPDADDFQNLISASLSGDTFLVKFS